MEQEKVHRGLQGILKKKGSFKSAIVITKRENGKLTSWWADPSDVESYKDETGKYRSRHAVLFKKVNGKFPDASSHQSWMGWSTKRSGPEFFSCTLNTKVGWTTYKNLDG